MGKWISAISKKAGDSERKEKGQKYPGIHGPVAPFIIEVRKPLTALSTPPPSPHAPLLMHYLSRRSSQQLVPLLEPSVEAAVVHWSNLTPSSGERDASWLERKGWLGWRVGGCRVGDSTLNVSVPWNASPAGRWSRVIVLKLGKLKKHFSPRG